MSSDCFPKLHLLPSSGPLVWDIFFAMGHPSVKRQPLRYIRVSRSYHVFPFWGDYVSRL